MAFKKRHLSSIILWLSVYLSETTHTHTHAQKNSLVMFCFFLFVAFSPVVCFDVYYLFVCLLSFCFAEVICCSCIAVTKAIMQIKYRNTDSINQASDRRHHAVEFIRNPVSSYYPSQVFIFMRLSSLALP